MSRSPLQLDFVAPRKRPRLLGIAVLTFALTVAGALVLKHREAQQRLHALDAVESLLSGARPAPVIPRERLEGEMKSAQATVRQLALPWAQLIDSLERAATKEVAVLHIQPDAQSRVLRVTAETRREERMLEYLRRLGATGNFVEVHLVSHQVREDDPQRPIQFSVQASFRGAQ
ncbi:MAG TPA: PilN domain-containing protein [Burkholderiales bacterium]|nr:PilN domain-containing protein [Burkholderiales bacterium]